MLPVDMDYEVLARYYHYVELSKRMPRLDHNCTVCSNPANDRGNRDDHLCYACHYLAQRMLQSSMGNL